MRSVTASVTASLLLGLLACSGSGDSPPGAQSTAAAEAKPNDASTASAEAKPADPTQPGAADKPAIDPPDTHPPDPDPAQPDTSSTEAVASKRAEAKAKIAADEAALSARRKTMLTTLNEGRKLVKDGDLPGGIAKYEALLKIDPHYGPALGELGWAEFKAGELDDASAHTLRALAVATEDNKRGMLLYNLGRVAEARGDTEAAIGYYQTSLAYRANDTVAARLAALDPDAKPAARPSAAAVTKTLPGLGVAGTGLADLQAVCAASSVDSLCVAEPDGCAMMSNPSGREDLGILHADDSGIVSCYSPMIKTSAGWTVFEPVLIGQWGSEVQEDVDAFATKVVSNEAGEFLVIEYEHHLYERGWAGDLEEDEDDDGPMFEEASTETRGVVVCTIAAAPTCTRAITTEFRYWGFGSETGQYTADWALRGNTLVISNVHQSGEIEPLGGTDWEMTTLLAAGEYSLAALASDP